MLGEGGTLKPMRLQGVFVKGSWRVNCGAMKRVYCSWMFSMRYVRRA